MSKTHEKVTFKQLSGDANKFRSQILCGFRKVRITQHVLFRLWCCVHGKKNQTILGVLVQYLCSFLRLMIAYYILLITKFEARRLNKIALSFYWFMSVGGTKN